MVCCKGEGRLVQCISNSSRVIHGLLECSVQTADAFIRINLEPFRLGPCSLRFFSDRYAGTGAAQVDAATTG